MEVLVKEKENIFELRPDIKGSDDKDIFRITTNAIKKIDEMVENNNVPESFYLRMGLRGGGPDSTKFFLEFDFTVLDNDVVIDLPSFQLIVDNRSLFYFLKFVVDYEEIDEEEGFVLSLWNDEK